MQPSRLKEERLHHTELCLSCALATIPRLTLELGILMASEYVDIFDMDSWRCSVLWIALVPHMLMLIVMFRQGIPAGTH